MGAMQVPRQNQAGADEYTAPAQGIDPRVKPTGYLTGDAPAQSG